MNDQQFVPNGNPNLQMVCWSFDHMKSDDGEDSTCIWVEEEGPCVTFDFFPIIGWMPFYVDILRLWMMSPVSFRDLDWMAVIDQATGQVFERNGLGCGSAYASLAELAAEVAGRVAERARQAQRQRVLQILLAGGVGIPEIEARGLLDLTEDEARKVVEARRAAASAAATAAETSSEMH